MKTSFWKGTPELRRDITNGEWVLIASRRARRPLQIKETRSDKPTPKKSCPFEKPFPSAVLWYSPKGRGEGQVKKDWILQVVKNKFPVVAPHAHSVCPTIVSEGPLGKMQGVGFHEVVIPRAHGTFLSDSTVPDAEIIVRAFQERFLSHREEKCVEYIFIFHNYGSRAGASVWHPHSQILALPIIPPDIQRSLSGSKLYWHERKKCVHCVIVNWERKVKKRLVYSNKSFVVIAPFASHVSCEMRIFPLKHEPRFENITAQNRFLFADALVTSLRKLKRFLSNPSYNFYIHTAPVGGGEHQYYHWHVEILPKTAHFAGVELGTGIEIITMEPERAAHSLRAA